MDEYKISLYSAPLFNYNDVGLNIVIDSFWNLVLHFINVLPKVEYGST